MSQSSQTVATSGRSAVPPNLADYQAACRSFRWDRARAELAGLPGGRGVNIADEAVDRHVRDGRGEHVALRCVAPSGPVTTVNYAGLAALSNRFANGLRALGIGRGDRVFTLLGRCPELYVRCSAR